MLTSATAIAFMLGMIVMDLLWRGVMIVVNKLANGQREYIEMLRGYLELKDDDHDR